MRRLSSHTLGVRSARESVDTAKKAVLSAEEQEARNKENINPATARLH